MSGPRPDVDSGAVWVLAQAYVRLVHGLRVYGRNNIPRGDVAGPLIVVANHTAGLDPVLVQSACRFHIRWMMAADMRAPALEWFWTWWQIIFVDREKVQGTGIRKAMRHLRDGGVVGIFPEGGLERPPNEIMPFRAGVGVLIERSKAPVLPVLIEDTPQYDPAWASLWRASRSKITFMEPIAFSGRGMTGEQIAAELRTMFLNLSGWPANNDPPPWEAEGGASAYGERVDDEGNRSRYGSAIPQRRALPERPVPSQVDQSDGASEPELSEPAQPEPAQPGPAQPGTAQAEATDEGLRADGGSRRAAGDGSDGRARSA